jgi:hypothetical protein
VSAVKKGQEPFISLAEFGVAITLAYQSAIMMGNN